MTAEQLLWNREQDFWAASSWPRIDDRRLTRDGRVAVLSYRVTGTARALRCRSTWTRAAGGWLLVEHRQSSA